MGHSEKRRTITDAAEAAGFDAFLMTDRNIRYLNVGILDRAEGVRLSFR
jgi:hypothetical protein